MFRKYIRSNSKEKKIPLMYLIIDGYDISKITKLIDAREDKAFGLKYRIIYGVTDELVDEKKITQELEEIKPPIIYSPQAFELYTKSPTIHVYTPKFETEPMIIHDFGVISSEMIITRKCIVSSNSALSGSEIPIGQRGFMYFVDYVLKEELFLENWHIIYNNKCFEVNYISKDKNTESEEMLYMALEIDKTSTYRLVIYIIKKVCEKAVKSWTAENFKDELYELIG